MAATKSEEWMINKAVHYNAWADLQSKEFAAVVSSFQQLLQMMQCPNTDCGEFLCVSPIKGDKESAPLQLRRRQSQPRAKKN